MIFFAAAGRAHQSLRAVGWLARNGAQRTDAPCLHRPFGYTLLIVMIVSFRAMLLVFLDQFGLCLTRHFFVVTEIFDMNPASTSQ